MERKYKYTNELINYEVAEILYDKLMHIREDEEFALGVMVSLKKDKDKARMIKLLDDGLRDHKKILKIAFDIKNGKM